MLDVRTRNAADRFRCRSQLRSRAQVRATQLDRSQCGARVLHSARVVLSACGQRRPDLPGRNAFRARSADPRTGTASRRCASGAPGVAASSGSIVASLPFGSVHAAQLHSARAPTRCSLHVSANAQRDQFQPRDSEAGCAPRNCGAHLPRRLARNNDAGHRSRPARNASRRRLAAAARNRFVRSFASLTHTHREVAAVPVCARALPPGLAAAAPCAAHVTSTASLRRTTRRYATCPPEFAAPSGAPSAASGFPLLRSGTRHIAGLCACVPPSGPRRARTTGSIRLRLRRPLRRFQRRSRGNNGPAPPG